MFTAIFRKTVRRMIIAGMILLLVCMSFAFAEDLFAVGEQNLRDHGLVLEDVISEYSEFGNSGNGFSGFWLPYLPDDSPAFSLFDVTGDGCVDLCTCVTWGSGMVRTDLVVYDPRGEHAIHAADCIANVDYNPYEGFPLNGRIKQVWLRGQLAVENGEILESEAGVYLPRNLPDLSL